MNDEDAVLFDVGLFREWRFFVLFTGEICLTGAAGVRLFVSYSLMNASIFIKEMSKKNEGKKIN